MDERPPDSLLTRLLRRIGAGEQGRRLAGGSAGSFLLKIGSMAATFATTVVLTRAIGADGFGAYAWAMSWVYLLLIPALLGLDRLLLRDLPTLAVRKRWGALRGLLRFARAGVAVTAGCLALAAGLGGYGLLGRADSVTPEMLTTLQVALFVLPVMALMRLRQTVLMAFQRVVLGQVGELAVMPLLHLGLMGGLAWWAAERLSGPVAAGALVLAATVGLAVVLVAGRGAVPSDVRTERPEYTIGPWLRAAFPMLLVAGMQVINQRVDILMVGGLLGAADAGVYAVANRGAMLILLVFYAVNAPLAPVVADLHARGESARLQNLVTRAARVMVALSAPAAAVMIVFARPFLGLFGAEFGSGTAPLIIMSAAQVVAMGFGSVSTVLLMTGLERSAALGAGVSAAVNISLNLLLIPRFGMVGAAWALAVGQVSAVGLMAGIAWRRRRIQVTPFGRTL